MSYHFFLSYAQTNNNPFLQQFFEDLSDTIRQRGMLAKGSTVGFMSQADIPLGGEWDPELIAALQKSRALVSLYSPAYFLSDNCGREWNFFQLRRRQYVNQPREGGEPRPRWPATIKPVVWVPLREPQPEAVRGIDHDLEDPNAAHNKLGLLTMTKLRKSKYESDYVEFLDKLADEILSVVEAEALPELDLTAYPTFESLPPAFPPAPVAAHQDAAPVAAADAADAPAEPETQRPQFVITKPKAVGPKFVQFVFAAGSPSEFIGELLLEDKYDPELARMLGMSPALGQRLRGMFEALREAGRESELAQVVGADPVLGADPELGEILKRLECYYDCGGGEWRPYIQEKNQRISPFVKSVALSSDPDIDVEVLPFGDDLVESVRRASTNRNLVIILVDSWTLDLSRYREILRGFDQNLFWNCSVMIPFNTRDPRLPSDPEQANPHLARLKDNIFNTFENWYKSFVPQPLKFCYSIHSSADLDSRIRETILALRNSFVNKVVDSDGAEIPAAPQSTISKSSVSVSNDTQSGAATSP